MKRPEIINNKIVNSVAQLARFLKEGDIFRKVRGATQYKFEKFVPDEDVVICENLDTHVSEEIYFNSPVFQLTAI
ncbi:hypothetical protein BH10BAC4_BH10BAC4_14410 [soil metagenome]